LIKEWCDRDEQTLEEFGKIPIKGDKAKDKA
jgi:hypothetical protein